MYTNYFGLDEPSFSITPDPQYLFLSEQHREALAHLLYGAGESDGFVLLTGEVGTGKTTVCRAFLGQLPEGVDVALILNPAMTATELLRAVCDEFRIQVPEAERTVKDLVDRLNTHLLATHAAGRRAVLMIDEAQNLRPRVLEQIRLLTNLETPKHKLLQIFLVGQPELRNLLRREGLRQLDQRITARYHLRPFSAAETVEYVHHRLAVAGVERHLFTRAALQRVHRISKGVPRLINILCERSLLGACVTRSPLVTKAIVNRAAQEVEDRDWRRHGTPRPLRGALIAASLLLALAAGWMIHSLMADDPFAPGWVPSLLARWLSPPPGDPAIDQTTDPTTAAPTDPIADASPIASESSTATAAGDDEEVPSLALAGLTQPITDLVVSEVVTDRVSAMRLLLRRWEIESEELGPGDPCTGVEDYGLRCEFDEGGLEGLRFFDRPALIELADADTGSGYAVVGALDAEQVTLDLATGERRFPIASLSDSWNGEYLILRQLPPAGKGVIGPGSHGASVRWLRGLLAQVPDLAIEDIDSPTFDRALGQAVRRFQRREGLISDGVAGPKTLIRLHDVLEIPDIPRLLAAPSPSPTP